MNIFMIFSYHIDIIRTPARIKDLFGRVLTVLMNTTEKYMRESKRKNYILLIGVIILNSDLLKFYSGVLLDMVFLRCFVLDMKYGIIIQYA